MLRYGGFYGPGTSVEDGGFMVDDLRRRRFPVVGAGTGVWSFVHIDDAAAATVAAVEREPRRIYQVVDDDPAPVSDWLPALPPPSGPAHRGRSRPGWPASLAASTAWS